MNTSSLKTFAPAVRTQLMEAVTRKLDFALAAQTPDYLTTFAQQVAALRKLAQADRAGLIDRVAYTWFNRFAALRFMDARGWHPFRARVLTPASAAETQPELLKLTRTGALPEELKSHTDLARLNDLLDGRIPSPDAQGEVYRHLVLAACRFYHALLPNLFEKLDDETELLLPDDLLTEHSVVHGFRTEISDEDCGDGQRANVEILGWLYQFYISERKDQVMARKSAVPTEDIPAVTQLFTPHWIVRYLVENSLGRLWLLNRPQSRLREHMPYYIEGEAETETDFLRISKPEDMRLCDPAVGSGHMLTYAFDLLFLIYEEEGYAPTEIPALILRHNLHGLEICPRAAQLAELALVFKAREKSRRFFQPEHLVRPHIIELQNITFTAVELADYFNAIGPVQGETSGNSSFNLKPSSFIFRKFEEAKNFGSLIQPYLAESEIQSARSALHTSYFNLHPLEGQLFLRETHLKVLRVLDQAEALTQRYHVVVANPPYLGGAQMTPSFKDFVKKYFPDSKADLFAVFIERGLTLGLPSSFAGLITMQSWMFLTSYEKLRERLVANQTFISMAHLGPRGFDSISGEVVQTTAFVLVNSVHPQYRGTFLRLVDGGSEQAKATAAQEAIKNPSCGWLHKVSTADFDKIPGRPFVYQLSEVTRTLFVTRPRLESKSRMFRGITTGNNELFSRHWHEVPYNNLRLRAASRLEAKESRLRWFPYNRGGSFRKWYGLASEVIDYQNDGAEMVQSAGAGLTPGFRHDGAEGYFQSTITWTALTSGTPSFRFLDPGFVLGHKGASIKFHSDQLYFLGLLSSKPIEFLLGILSPTLDITIAQLSILPVTDDVCLESVAAIAEEAISIARADWDNFETSWDFRDQPLLRPGLKGARLEASWRNWEAQSTAAVRRMQELETENNRLFIAAYGLDGELQPEVPEAQITLARAEARRDMAAFLSYAVGCMMGRYSPDHPGLILANAGDSLEQFRSKMEDGGLKMENLSFIPDEDGIIPVLDGEWFEDDIVARTRDFLRATFGEATLRENLRFLEDSLGKDLRKYFLNDFYKDHLQTYKKRPIYWLVQSPKKGFSVLLYLHRYTRDTMNLVLNRYLRDYQVKLRNRVTHLTQEQATAPSAREKTEARKEADKLTKTIHECEEWERQTLLPLAQARIELDLDDGVKTNYLKLGEALAPIAGLAAKED